MVRILGSSILGIDQCQRSFKPLTDTITRWKQDEVSETMAKRLIYKAFIEGQLDAPARLARDVHSAYFNPTHPEFEPRTKWSLNNAFSESFKQLDAVPAHKAASALGRFFEAHEL